MQKLTQVGIIERSGQLLYFCSKTRFFYYQHESTINLSMSRYFFQLFFERYLCKMAKKKITKKNLALAHSSLKKKYKIPLCSKKWNCMKTSPYLQVGAVLKHHYNVNPFLQKKNHKISIFHRNLVWFSCFFKISILEPIYILPKNKKHIV